MKNILAFGNPLLDITVSSHNIFDLLKKYNLERDGQKEICAHEMNLLRMDIQCLEQTISPGGCCQNSLRVLQWILKKKCQVSIFGSVGKDKEAEILRSIVESEGIYPRYIEQEDLPTGQTVALINGPYRSLVAHIGAAGIFPIQFLLSYDSFHSVFDSSDIIFIEAFFLPNRMDVINYVVDLCKDRDKMLVFNLCGEYIFEVVPEPIRLLVQHSNIVFGNKSEFEALRKISNYNSIDEMAFELLSLNQNSKYGKTLVITDGPNVVKCYHGSETLEIKPNVVNEAELKDTTGAGDAFIGGFLAGLCILQDLKECIKTGFYAASNIIKQRGCSLPTTDSEISLAI